MDWVWGAMDVAILNGERYVLLSGAGPSWVSPTARSGVYKINDDSTMTMIADVTTWLPQHRPKFVPPDYGADGSLFALEVMGDSLILSEGVGEQIIEVTPAGDSGSCARWPPTLPRSTSTASIFPEASTSAPMARSTSLAPPNGANHGEGWPARVNMAGEVEDSPTANCPSMATPAA
ncbi:MAG: hypothetical protein IT338_12355 [Thermomicrobiales bacterium]|nr:hypothetical protein [Thermomicrobiales bacterium]